MQKSTGDIIRHLLGSLYCYLRRCIFAILSVGPVPNHIAFIMDGNRRYAKKRNMKEGDGHKAGFTALMSILRYCYELGVKYVTVYAFSIDNFKRKPKEVQTLMELMREKIEELLQQESLINEYGVRLHFIGDLQLLTEPVRAVVEKAMRVTAHNNQRVLLICVAYTSRHEIVNAVQELESAGKKDGVFDHNVEKHAVDHIDAEITSCTKLVEMNKARMYKQGEVIKLVDIEKQMYMAVAPDPDIMIRTSGEARLSNFLLWQTSTCPLYAPTALWPEIGLRHLVWAVLNFQRHHFYLEKKKKHF
uniref:Alkyl transferase n=1 Tax=Cajanus cajan TaxID=3821 RepID=A0A151RD81_CAJCA|nr:Dehydrodolichyl diphosphate synthase 6 [Cajanus cajan]